MSISHNLSLSLRAINGDPLQTDKVEEQCKKKTILEVAKPLPYMKNRELVKNERTFIMSAIETGIELIQQRADAMQLEAQRDPVQINQLQILLQGTVRLQVNAGPTAICQAFLGNPDLYPEEKVQALRKAFEQFLETCQKCLDINKDLSTTPPMLLFHQELVVGYNDLKQFVDPYLNAKGD